METHELTPKQKKVMDFIRIATRKKAPPTIREIGQAVHLSSTGTVRDYLNALEKKGYLRRINNKSRAIQILRGEKIPIIGTIMAGGPDLAVEDVIGYLDPNEILNTESGQIFALRVRGDSMIDAGILEGDTAIIQKQSTAYNGDIIAALLDNNEVTLKRIRLKAGQNAHLEPANKNYQPIHKEFTVIGKVINIVRNY
jgi:repressor LexA